MIKRARKTMKMKATGRGRVNAGQKKKKGNGRVIDVWKLKGGDVGEGGRGKARKARPVMFYLSAL